MVVTSLYTYINSAFSLDFNGRGGFNRVSHNHLGAEPLDMDAPTSASTMAGGWDINSSRPIPAPALHFTSPFDIKPPMIDTSLRSHHLNAGLAPSPSLTHNLGDYLANHSHRLMVGSNFGQTPMIGLRTTDPPYYMKEFVPRSEDIVSFFEQSRASRRAEDDLTVADSPAGGTSLSTPTVPESRFPNDVDVGITCLHPFSSKLLPMLAMEKHTFNSSNMDVKAEEERAGAGNDDKNEDGDDDDDEDEDEDDDGGGGGGDEDDDDGASAWPSQSPTSGSVASKGMIVIRQAASTRGSSPIACQDCGNQAKKDCTHMRCRTCCKSRGLQCATHVKSTWVPAYKRRQRQQLFSNDPEQPVKLLRSKSARASRPTPERGVVSANATNSHTSTSTGTPPPSSDLNWLQQEGRFKRLLPAEAREQAVFKCVKITGVNDGHEEYAYQTVVKIGGHVYKGILYDHGVDKGGQASMSSIAELRLGGRNAAPSSSATIDLAANLYGTSESVFLGGNNATH